MARTRANVLFLSLLILGLGCHHNTPSSNQPPPDLAQLALSDISLSFTPAGRTSRAQTITLTNTGTAALTLSSITLSDTVNYAMTSNCGSSLTAPSSCTLTVTFKPHAADYSAVIHITSNDAQSPHTIRLNGTPTAAP